MNKLMNLIILTFFLTTSLQTLNYAGDHTVSTNIEITSTAINRYLNNQYNQLSFPRSFNVVYNGTTYTFSLTLPEIILTPNNAKLKMVFDINTGSINVYHFEIDPSISISSGQITTEQVSGYLTNLVEVLNTISFIPQWVKDKINQYYNSLGYLIYPSRLIDELDSDWIKNRGLTIDPENIALSYQVVEGAFKFTLSIPIHSQTPRFFSMIGFDQNGPAAVIRSYDINCAIDEIRIFDVSGVSLQTDTNYVYIQKGEDYWEYLNFSPQPTQVYQIWILFRIEHTNQPDKHDGTFYVRKYRADGQGLTSVQIGSIN